MQQLCRQQFARSTGREWYSCFVHKYRDLYLFVVSRCVLHRCSSVMNSGGLPLPTKPCHTVVKASLHENSRGSQRSQYVNIRRARIHSSWTRILSVLLENDAIKTIGRSRLCTPESQSIVLVEGKNCASCLLLPLSGRLNSANTGIRPRLLWEVNLVSERPVSGFQYEGRAWRIVHEYTCSRTPYLICHLVY